MPATGAFLSLTWQLEVLVLDEDAVTAGAELGGVEEADHLAGFCQSDKLFPVEALWVVNDTASIDDAG